MSQEQFLPHPRGSNAKVLLTSVFGPYAVDDEFGSRKINPMELYHNQVTRVQGPFSLRMFHRSWGLMFIQANIHAPCHLLDFPTLARFEEELDKGDYDIVGVGSIIPNVEKVRKMCEVIRERSPKTVIVVGGHVANIPGIHDRLDADYIIHGDGVRWFQKYLGEDETAPIRHPLIYSGFGSRMLGVTLSTSPAHTAATLIPSVGCPMGCNFCSTSAMFGGKGKFINFYETGQELFDIMCQLEEAMKVNTFFVMDENFLLHKKRALELLDLMEKHGKAWSMYVFSSANVLRSYKMEQIVGLGVMWVWMGLEGEDSSYQKLKGADTFGLVKELQSHGIRVLGSTIVGLEEHTPENMDAAIDYAIKHDTDFHQFMLYTAVQGTPLYEEHLAKGTLITSDVVGEADIHGQLRFNHVHPHLPPGSEESYLLGAFQKDFDTNGPSVVRIARTLLQGWKKYKKHPNKRIRKRYIMDTAGLWSGYAGVLWASEKWFRRQGNLHVVEKIRALRRDFVREFGLKARVCAPIVGRFVTWSLRKEDQKLKEGWLYEPRTFFDRNYNPPKKVKLHPKRPHGYSLWVKPEQQASRTGAGSDASHGHT